MPSVKKRLMGPLVIPCLGRPWKDDHPLFDWKPLLGSHHPHSQSRPSNWNNSEELPFRTSARLHLLARRVPDTAGVWVKAWYTVHSKRAWTSLLNQPNNRCLIHPHYIISLLYIYISKDPQLWMIQNGRPCWDVVEKIWTWLHTKKWNGLMIVPLISNTPHKPCFSIWPLIAFICLGLIMAVIHYMFGHISSYILVSGRSKYVSFRSFDDQTSN